MCVYVCVCVSNWYACATTGCMCARPGVHVLNKVGALVFSAGVYVCKAWCACVQRLVCTCPIKLMCDCVFLGWSSCVCLCTCVIDIKMSSSVNLVQVVSIILISVASLELEDALLLV
jgi:hypothetical protein